MDTQQGISTSWFLVADAVAAAREQQELGRRAESTIARGDVSAVHFARILGATTDLNRCNLPELAERFWKARRAEGAGDGTVQKEIGYAVMGLERGRELGWFRGDPERIYPRALKGYRNRPRTRVLTVEEYAALIDVAVKAARHPQAVDRTDELRAYVLTGARQAELFTIRKDGVDLERRVLRINGTKTVGSVREVPILDELMPAIERRLQTDGPVLFDPPWHRARMHQNLRRWCAEAKIAPVTANDLRRTFATWMAERGVPESLLLRFMGHTSSTMLRSVYTQVTDKMHADTIARFGRALS